MAGWLVYSLAEVAVWGGPALARLGAVALPAGAPVPPVAVVGRWVGGLR